jgi:hypothetical protein
MQDAVNGQVKGLLGFNIDKPLETVYSFLQDHDCLDLLKDPYLALATSQIVLEGKTRPQIQRAIKQKNAALKHLKAKYYSKTIDEDAIHKAIYSIGDNHSYQWFNRDPCDRMLQYLDTLFDPESYEEGFSLAISGGRDGARLTHSHGMQYHYIKQSLTLWRDILDDMYHLWFLAEQDLLDPNNKYELRDTGQGVQRVQQAPRTLKAIKRLQHRSQMKSTGWVGSSVVHLGDNNVPNALMFIDKYGQVGQILMPIVNCLRQIPRLYEDDENTKRFIDKTWGGIEALRLDILSDFFRHGFDGSGADNFFAAGSCIDGRMTSAWHWCSTIKSKKFYPVFLLTGFTSFSGKFDK